MYSHYQFLAPPVKARKYVPGESLENIIILREGAIITEDNSVLPLEYGADTYEPKEGDMIILENGQQLLVTQEYFEQNYRYLY
jgi:hypothetical protein